MVISFLQPSLGLILRLAPGLTLESELGLESVVVRARQVYLSRQSGRSLLALLLSLSHFNLLDEQLASAAH